MLSNIFMLPYNPFRKHLTTPLNQQLILRIATLTWPAIDILCAMFWNYICTLYVITTSVKKANKFI